MSTKGILPTRFKSPLYIKISFPFFIVWFFFLLVHDVRCRDMYHIDRDQSKIEGKVRYIVIGHYNPRFNKFNGYIRVSPSRLKDMAVKIWIEPDSISSKLKKIDKIAKSKLLLNVKSYPFITFESLFIEKKKEQYFITGILNLHGIEKKLTFPFNLQGPFFDINHRKCIKANGEWKLNRKNFDIIWHPLLDKGGIVVEDQLRIIWDVTAYVKE